MDILEIGLGELFPPPTEFLEMGLEKYVKGAILHLLSSLHSFLPTFPYVHPKSRFLSRGILVLFLIGLKIFLKIEESRLSTLSKIELLCCNSKSEAEKLKGTFLRS